MKYKVIAWYSHTDYYNDVAPKHTEIATCENAANATAVRLYLQGLRFVRIEPMHEQLPLQLKSLKAANRLPI